MLWKEAKTTKADIVCAQETHLKRDSPVKIRNSMFPHVYSACSEKKKAGVLVAIKNSVQFSLLQSVLDPNGRFIILVCQIDNVLCTIVNSYSPNSRQIAFLNKLWRRINEVKQGRIVWCGDFNGINDALVDSTSRGLRPPLQLGSWFTKLQLFDAWRCYHASERDYTFYSPVHKSFSRIDMFMVDWQSLQMVDKCDIGTISWSDHAPITLSIRLTNTLPVPFIWKNNTFLLANPEIKKEVSAKLEEFFILNSLSVPKGFTLWNAHKAYIRGILIQISSKWKKDRNRTLNELFHTIERLENIMKHAPSMTHHKELLDARLSLRQHLMADFESQLKKSKIRHYNLMNKPSKLMARRVAAVRCKTKIPFIYDQTSKHKILHPQEIADEFSKFYCKLYNLKDEVSSGIPSAAAIESFLDSIQLPSLSETQLVNLNVPFSESEITATIKSLPNGKSPGPDGFSNEYLKLYQPILVPHLCSTFNYVMTGGSIPAENMQATIVTLPKPGKSPDIPANFRPISLLNSDLKLYAKVLARRLFTVLPSLINKDQVGFIKGRQAPDGTRRLLNIISSVELSKTPTLLLSLDAEKAFDRIYWGFIFKTLDKFGFAGNIYSAMTALYTVPSARVLANGILSKPFQISNGTRRVSSLPINL